jgi:ABC-type multidrug transport system ATPase subunit
VLVLDRLFQHVGIHCVLNDVSLRVSRGEGLLLIGPNGAGKTLLMRMLVGLDLPSAGRVRLFGQHSGRRWTIAPWARCVGASAWCLQRGSLLDGMTVWRICCCRCAGGACAAPTWPVPPG